jgi:hypothetical protein
MGDEQYRPVVVFPDLQQHFLHQHPGLRVERAERLVHQQHRWAIDQRSRDRDALQHAAGELGRQISRECR